MSSIGSYEEEIQKKGKTMIVQPKIRGFICTTAHPLGCAKNVQEQIDYVKSRGSVSRGPKRVLVIGASTGYGLATRIVSAFACRAATLGVFFERPAENHRTATAGWYNSTAFERAAQAEGLYAKNINGDAFSDEVKAQVCSTVKQDLGQVDLVVYSLASPRRLHPRTGKLSKSILRPAGQPFTNKSMDFETGQVTTVTLPSATQEEIDQTIDVMGGEDWQLWMDALLAQNLLAQNGVTVAYSYIGPAITNAVYRSGTIGAAKDHLEATARNMDAQFKSKGIRAFVSVNKALVTQSSSAIPFIPLYFVLLMDVMKAKGIHEDCIHQMYRLFADRLYTGQSALVDELSRIRVDDWEMRADVQAEVEARWARVNSDNVRQLADVEGYQKDFLRLFGFGLDGVDYSADVQI